MTPLIDSASNITPAQGIFNSFWCSVVVPELTAQYSVPHGTVPQNYLYSGNGIPIQGPIYRALAEVSFELETGAGLTAGRLVPFGLMLDGNWHSVGIGSWNLAASTSYYATISAGVVLSNIAMTLMAGPFLGYAIGVYTPVLTGGNINYVEITARAKEIDPAFVFGPRAGALIT